MKKLSEFYFNSFKENFTKLYDSEEQKKENEKGVLV